MSCVGNNNMFVPQAPPVAESVVGMFTPAEYVGLWKSYYAACQTMGRAAISVASSSSGVSESGAPVAPAGLRGGVKRVMGKFAGVGTVAAVRAKSGWFGGRPVAGRGYGSGGVSVSSSRSSLVTVAAASDAVLAAAVSTKEDYIRSLGDGFCYLRAVRFDKMDEVVKLAGNCPDFKGLMCLPGDLFESHDVLAALRVTLGSGLAHVLPAGERGLTTFLTLCRSVQGVEFPEASLGSAVAVYAPATATCVMEPGFSVGGLGFSAKVPYKRVGLAPGQFFSTQYPGVRQGLFTSEERDIGRFIEFVVPAASGGAGREFVWVVPHAASRVEVDGELDTSPVIGLRPGQLVRVDVVDRLAWFVWSVYEVVDDQFRALLVSGRLGFGKAVASMPQVAVVDPVWRGLCYLPLVDVGRVFGLGKLPRLDVVLSHAVRNSACALVQVTPGVLHVVAIGTPGSLSWDELLDSVDKGVLLARAFGSSSVFDYGVGQDTVDLVSALSLKVDVPVLRLVALSSAAVTDLELVKKSAGVLSSDAKRRFRLFEQCGDAVITHALLRVAVDAGRDVQWVQEERSACTSNASMAGVFVDRFDVKGYSYPSGVDIRKSVVGAKFVEAVVGFVDYHLGFDSAMKLIEGLGVLESHFTY